MSLGRLKKIEDMILQGSVINDRVSYSISEIKAILAVVAEEKSKQDRKSYFSQYYIENQEEMNERSSKYYREHSEEIQIKRKMNVLKKVGENRVVRNQKDS